MSGSRGRLEARKEREHEVCSRELSFTVMLESARVHRHGLWTKGSAEAEALALKKETEVATKAKLAETTLASALANLQKAQTALQQAQAEEKAKDNAAPEKEMQNLVIVGNGALADITARPAKA